MSQSLKVGDKIIGKDCFVIAEIGVNHIISKKEMADIGLKSALEVAFLMIDTAKKAGVDAVKFQSFKAENLQLKNVNKPSYQQTSKSQDSYYEMIKSLETSKENQIKIADYCRENDIIFLSTPYDKESVDFLDEKIGVEAFKLASIELNNHLFTKYVASKEKPMFMSTGLSSMKDVESAVKVARENHYVDRIVLLQCTSDYPAKPKEINLNVLKTYQKKFPDIVLGFSDHSPTDTASIGAVALGAKVLEKHFTLNKEYTGPDHAASLEPQELTSWVSKVREIEKAMGSYQKNLSSSEKENISMRKYLVIKPLEIGYVITEESLTAMRTGKGILPTQKNLKNIIGRKLKKEVKELEIFDWDMVS